MKIDNQRTVSSNPRSRRQPCANRLLTFANLLAHVRGPHRLGNLAQRGFLQLFLALPLPIDRPDFEKNEFVVYPAYGVGQITTIEGQTVAGCSLEFFVVYFSKNKLRARVPTQKAVSSNKSTIGHTRPAADIIEEVFTFLTLEHQRMPPTIEMSRRDGREVN